MAAEQPRPSIALVAHDARKDAMVGWVQDHRDQLAGFDIYCTGTTGQCIKDATGLELTRLLSGPLGGDQQLGAMIAEDKIKALVFFFDPLSAVPHDVDVKALLRISALYETATATNERTASMVLFAMSHEEFEVKQT